MKSYSIPRPDINTRVAARLSPLRKLNADRMLEHLAWHGGKLFLDDRAYAALNDRGLDRATVDQAVNDLYALELIDVHLVDGTDVQVVSIVANRLGAAAVHTEKSAGSPRFTLASRPGGRQ